MVNGMAVVADAAPVGNPEIVRLLEALLRDAQAGRVVGVGVAIAMRPGEFNAMLSGTCLGEVNLALDALKGILMNALRGPQSSILRPR